MGGFCLPELVLQFFVAPVFDFQALALHVKLHIPIFQALHQVLPLPRVHLRLEVYEHEVVQDLRVDYECVTEKLFSHRTSLFFHRTPQKRKLRWRVHKVLSDLIALIAAGIPALPIDPLLEHGLCPYVALYHLLQLLLVLDLLCTVVFVRERNPRAKTVPCAR